MSDYAIIETGGKQYRVIPGETLTSEVVSGANAGDTVSFDRVLLVKDGDQIRVGSPYLDGTQVSAEVEKVGRTRKMIVFKYKPKKRYRRKRGHRQHYMVSRIKEISA
jgi:large subunit ribosomal protein L21